MPRRAVCSSFEERAPPRRSGVPHKEMSHADEKIYDKVIYYTSPPYLFDILREQTQLPAMPCRAMAHL